MLQEWVESQSPGFAPGTGAHWNNPCLWPDVVLVFQVPGFPSYVGCWERCCGLNCDLESVIVLVLLVVSDVLRVELPCDSGSQTLSWCFKSECRFRNPDLHRVQIQTRKKKSMPLAGWRFLHLWILWVPVTPGVGADVVTSFPVILGMSVHWGVWLPLGVVRLVSRSAQGTGSEQKGS